MMSEDRKPKLSTTEFFERIPDARKDANQCSSTIPSSAGITVLLGIQNLFLMCVTQVTPWHSGS